MSLLFSFGVSFLVISAMLLGGFSSSFALTSQEEKVSLEQELQQLEEQIKQYEQDITKTQAQKATLQNQISVLKTKIKQIDAQIAQSNRLIGDLKVQITDTTASISKTTEDIDLKKEELAGILQRMYEEEQKPLLEILAGAANLSEFFDNLAGLESLNSKNQELLLNIQQLNVYLQEQKVSLEGDKEDEESFVKIQILQRAQSQSVQKEQEKLFEVTKGKESEYQKLLSDTQKRAQEIRSRIFELIGVPQAPTFGQALDIAKSVSAQTGIRPALLLAVLTQESNLGKNVGQCYVKNLQTGSGVRVTGAAISKVMSPSRDIPKFLAITSELLRDPLITPVSCPIPSVGGWGGAMGPAQFIPSTWALYQSKLHDIAGRPVDPWNINDAFLATGVYLKDLGGAKNEFSAVMHYFSGATWTKYEEFYGRSVLAIATGYEADIKTLSQ